MLGLVAAGRLLCSTVTSARTLRVNTSQQSRHRLQQTLPSDTQRNCLHAERTRCGPPPTPLMLCFYNGSGSGRIDKDYGCQDFPSGHTADLLILLGPCLTAHRPTIGKKKTPKKKSMSSPPPPTAPCSLLKMIHAKDPEIREFKRRKASISLYFYFLSLMKQQGVFAPFG